MNPAKIEYQLDFGPFRMVHFQQQVDERFRQTFFSYLVDKVMPLLDGEVVRITGRVGSNYDRPEFAELTTVRARFCYEVSFHSALGTEEAWGEVDYHGTRQTGVWTPSGIQPCRVSTLGRKLMD